MKFNKVNPPREFKVGLENQIIIKDCGTIQLKPNEQITFLTGDGKEYDVARKDWGFYSTPSMNGRLKKFGFKTALVKNSFGMYYVMVVENKKLDDFQTYLDKEKNEVVEWLDELK